MAISADDLMWAAESAHKAGRFGEAEALCHEILRSHPNHLAALALLGIQFAKSGQGNLALPWLRKAQVVAPSSYEVALWLGISHRLVGEIDSAVKALEFAKRAAPGHPFILFQLGLSHLARRDAAKALSAFEQAIKANPNESEFHHEAAKACQLLGESSKVISYLNRAAQLDPTSFQVLVTLGNAYLEQANRTEAIRQFRAAYHREPSSARGLIQLARAYREEGELDKAEETLDQALQLEPNSADAQELVSNLLQQLGKFEEAAKALDSAIQLEPERRRLYFSRVTCTRVSDSDAPLVQKLEDLLAAEGNDLQDRRNLHYALAKAYSDLGNLELSMEQYNLANGVMRKLMGSNSLDRGLHKREFDKKISVFTRDFLESHRSLGSDSPQPVFIVGMIRSGTTLVEQVISSHPKVAGGGELPYWLEKSRGHIGPGVGRDGKPISREDFVKLQGEYLSLLTAIADGLPRTTDKMPHNYLYLGNINLAFPNAKIIHCKRNPADNCFSIYSTPYRAPLDFAHDKENIVFAYKEYLRLMEHWRQILPAGALMELQYEELVSDPEFWTRELIEFLGLEWDDACLRPEDNKRIVKTPSLWQVRQPIYNSSVQKWKRFEQWVPEFAALNREQESPA